MVEVPRRPTMQEIQARRKSSISDSRLIKRLGMSLPNLGDDQISFQRSTLLTRIIMSDTGEKNFRNKFKVLFFFFASSIARFL